MLGLAEMVPAKTLHKVAIEGQNFKAKTATFSREAFKNKKVI
jgi:hypothetical protein